MTVDTGSLTTILDEFLSVFRLGRGDVAVHAWSLLTTMATIEIVLASLWWALTGQDALVGLIRRLLFIGFFVFVVQNYDSLLHTVIEGFIRTGKTAASSGAANFSFVRDPSTIVDAGFVAVLPIFEHLQSYSGLDVIQNIHDIIITGLCAIAIVAGYFIIAIQVFVTYLEFAIVSTLGLILVPFGVFRHTAFLAEKVFGSIISFGVKLMVLGLLVSVTVPVLREFTVPPSPDWKALFNLALVALAVAALAWHAPGVAAGMLAGGPSLTAGTAAGSAIAATSAATAAPHIAHTTASSVGKSGITAMQGATSSMAGIAGLATAGAIGTASKLNAAGHGRAVQIAGGVAGATYALIADGARTAFRPFRRLGSIASENYAAKQNSVASYVGLKAKEALPNVGSAQVAIPGGTGALKNPKPVDSQQNASKSSVREPADDYSKVKEALRLARQSTPPTAKPAGGISVPLNTKGEKPNE